MRNAAEGCILHRMVTESDSRAPGRILVFLVSGDRGVGKTTLCERLVGEARGRGITAGGVLCPGIFGQGGEKTGCLARDVSTGKEWPLGSRTEDLDGIRWKGWSFSRLGFQQANRAVRDALDSGRGLVVLDEVGPVELRLRSGLEPSLRRLDEMFRDAGTRDAGQSPSALLIVRTELLEELSARYSVPEGRVVTVDKGNREEAYLRLSSRIFG